MIASAWSIWPRFFSVTRETIRSDLNALARQRLVQRCHGGAIMIRRSLQSQLITETGKDFEVLLKKNKESGKK
ncbi:hypothetical protein OS11_30300 [Dickeya oryzae]